MGQVRFDGVCYYVLSKEKANCAVQITLSITFLIYVDCGVCSWLLFTASKLCQLVLTCMIIAFDFTMCMS
jgi:hypothetical protein